MSTITEAQLIAMQSRLAGKKTAVTAYRGFDGPEWKLRADCLALLKAHRWTVFYNLDWRIPANRPDGEMDLICFGAGGRTLLVELKTRTGKLSESQQSLKTVLESAGHVVHIVRSVAQLDSLLCH